MGDGLYGVEAAAERYFGTTAARLDAWQSALLAAALPDPRRSNPAAPRRYLAARAAIIMARAERVRLLGLSISRRRTAEDNRRSPGTAAAPASAPSAGLVRTAMLPGLIMEREPGPARYARVQDVRVPTFIYGTAWKEDDTARLTRMALDAGFRGIDTANQRRHYHEAGVGEAVAAALAVGLLRREDVFLQTKFTHVGGQDHRLPYDPRAPLATQVEQSFASSLQHLGVDRLDAYILHGPSVARGLSAEDWEAWEAMERLQGAGKARLLGVSNVNVAQLAELCAGASTKPAIVQNRCFAATGWDRAVRHFCGERDIVYQGFSLLTANPDALRHRRVHEIASRTGRTVPQVIFRFSIDVGMTALTGTTSGAHMAEDLGVYDFELPPDDARALEELGAR